MVILRKKTDQRRKPAPKTYLYQKKPRFFAQVADSLKDDGLQELKDLGATDISPSFRGIYFTADNAALYRINYCSRLLSRVLAPLVSFDCMDTDSLYTRTRQITWTDFIDEDRTFAVFANVSDSRIRHSKFAALRVKDAIVDHMLEHAGIRPKVATINPDIGINLHIRSNMADISFDVSGGALHRRGYREETVSAPMQETVAAGVIRMTGWNGKTPLYDPMCGSGTLLCEALMRYCRIPAGIFRKQFGFEFLPDFAPAIWQDVKTTADGKIRKLPKGLIAGSDQDEKAVDAARTNLMGIQFGNRVEIRQENFNNLAGLEGQTIVTNPPYGIRMGADTDMAGFYRNLGDFLKNRCKGATAYIYFGDRQFIKHIGLKPAWKKPLGAGGLDGRLAKYQLF